MRSGAIACLILASCSQLTGLTEFGAGASGGEDGGSLPTGQSPSSEVPSGVQDAPRGVVDSGAPDADASRSAPSAGDGGSSPEVDSEAAAETNADAATGPVPDAAVDGMDAGADSGVDAAPPMAMDAAPDVGTDAAPDAGPLLTFTPTSASLSILASDAGVCSMNGAQTASLDLVNASDAGVTLMWISQAPACSETSYGNVAPGGSQSVSKTYVTHVWRLVDQTSGQFIAEFRLDSAANYTVTLH